MTPKLSVVQIVTNDIDASLAFYRRLGLAVPEDLTDKSHVAYELPGGMSISWDPVETVKSFDPDFTMPTGSGLALAFDCATPAGVDEIFCDLMDAGYQAKHKPWDAFWGMRYATVLDPDGYGVDLFAPLK
ncbi:VOC family protein [Fodinicola acaciae]|uniref:VOC family protein n=1 Tax=Fodinicola acaciae TaxID=2681555 RepID=UPI0013D85A52|nr:VOC family protein [Fodinicola acaciae]